MHLIFRSVRPDDKPRVLAFTAHTWDDGDYIHEVFDDWLADPNGRFIAVERAGQVVAIARLVDLGEGELWLEGLRVDPDHRQQGIGEALHRHNIELARQSGGRVLRYATGLNNTVSRLFADRTGFQSVGHYRWHAADPSAEFPWPESLTLADWPALQPWLGSPLLRSMQGVYARVWKWSRLSEARLRAHLAAGQVFGLRDGSGLRAWAIGEVKDGWDEALLQHFDGVDRPALVDMAQSMRRFAADRGRKIGVFALDPSPLLEALKEAGYRGEEFVMVVLELRMPNEE